jgi:D-glucosaminate-6-phosphate ammonia-lyase
VPVLVDGALYAPPLDNLHRWFDEGAALVALSGGKHLRGPQASGILCGRADLIALVGAQHQDMDEREATWVRGGDRITPPRHGVGRAMKVGREQIAGLLAAVARYVAEPGVDDAEGIAELQRLQGLLDGSPVPAVWHETSVLGVPVIELQVTEAGFDVDVVVNALAARSVPVYLEEGDAWRGVLVIHPMGLIAGDADELASAIAELAALKPSMDERNRP